MKHSAIRQHIIDTASELFYTNGYNRTGINMVIAESGVAKATLYSHFKSKDDLCLAYLQDRNSSFLANISSYCRAKPAGNDQIIGLFDFLLEFFNSKAFNGCWCINTISEVAKDDVIIKAEIQHQKRVFLSLVQDLVFENKDKYTVVEAGKLARKIYLLYESGVAESHLHKEDWPIESAKEMCVDLIA
jgi:AcrR family transcriptional regulator